MFERIRNWLAERRQERLNAMTLRLEELIKTANTNEPHELAVYLVEQGVCDAQEVRRREDMAEICAETLND